MKTSGKSYDLPSENSGKSLFLGVGSTTLQITNSAGKIQTWAGFRSGRWYTTLYFKITTL